MTPMASCRCYTPHVCIMRYILYVCIMYYTPCAMFMAMPGITYNVGLVCGYTNCAVHLVSCIWLCQLRTASDIATRGLVLLSDTLLLPCTAEKVSRRCTLVLLFDA